MKIRLLNSFAPSLTAAATLSVLLGCSQLSREEAVEHCLYIYRDPSRSFTSSGRYSPPGATGDPLFLDNRTITNHVTGVEARQRVAVHYPAGKSRDAGVIADLCEDAIRRIEATFDIAPLRKLELYVINNSMTNGRPVDFTFTNTPGTLIFPVALNGPLSLKGEQSPEAKESAPLPSAPVPNFVPLLHETVEFYLVDGRTKPMLLSAIKSEKGGRTSIYDFGTRAFRDGFATYAANRAWFESLQASSASGDFQTQAQALLGQQDASLESLGRLSDTVLAWRQFQRNDRSDLYYQASMGIFVKLERDFGVETIVEWLSQMKAHDYLDAEGVEQAFRTVYQMSIKDYLRDAAL